MRIADRGFASSLPLGFLPQIADRWIFTPSLPLGFLPQTVNPVNFDRLKLARRSSKESLGDLRKSLGGIGDVKMVEVVAQ
jgi:hypothetical protein